MLVPGPRLRTLSAIVGVADACVCNINCQLEQIRVDRIIQVCILEGVGWSDDLWA